MPYIIATEVNDRTVYLQDKVKRLNGCTVREWSPNKDTALVLFVNQRQMHDYVRKNLWDIREQIECVYIKTSPKPPVFRPVST